MLRRVGIPSLAAVALALASCSSTEPSTAQSNESVVTTATATATTAAAAPASAATIDACRGLARNEELNKLWQEVDSGATSVSTMTLAGAFLAVQHLELAAAYPGVEPKVASAMTTAATAATAMRARWVDAARFDPSEFRAIVTRSSRRAPRQVWT